MATTGTDERVATLETDMRNEREWRREMLAEMRAGFARLDAKIDSNQRWLVGLLVLLLITIIGGIIGVSVALFVN